MNIDEKNYKKFWTVTDDGDFLLRDLKYEFQNWFDRENGNFDESKHPDSYNSCWYELFETKEYGAEGCDYERYGCQIKPGDVVVDIGGNIGIFAHRAETRGASEVYSFEPMSLTFEALSINAGPKTRVFKNAIYSDTRIIEMSIPESKSNTGGGMITEKLGKLKRPSSITEKVLSIPINDLFNENVIGKIDFLKMDIEGAEVECLESITDKNLSSLRCLAAEFHRNVEGVDELRERFLERCNRLGFNHFTLYYQGGQQMTLNIWKK